MVTVLARADLCYHNKQIHTLHKDTHTLLLLLLEFPTRIGQLTYCIPHVLRASLVRTEQQSKQTQVELYYQPLNTSSRNCHRSSKIQLVDCRSCKIKKGFLGSRYFLASLVTGELAWSFCRWHKERNFTFGCKVEDSGLLGCCSGDLKLITWRRTLEICQVGFILFPLLLLWL